MALQRAENIINKEETLEQNYDILNELGRGRFAVVKKCVCKKTGTIYAAKVIKKSRTGNHGRSGREQLLLEIDILHQSQHPKLVRLFDVFETRTEMQLVLEFAQGGDLHRHCIEADVARTEKEICYLIRQIVEAICYLHNLKIVHLDLKPDNILLKEAGEIFPEIRLIDFGLSRRLDLPYSQFDIVGTPEYVAPEVLAYEPIDFGSDMWSIGVVTYVLLSGISPFAGDDVMETYSNIGMVDYDFDCEEFDDVSDIAMNFIEKLLERRPKDRMTAAEAFEHEWIKQLEQGITAEDVVLAQNLKTSQAVKSDSKPLENAGKQQQPEEQQNYKIEAFIDESNSYKKPIQEKDDKSVEKSKNISEVESNLKDAPATVVQYDVNKSISVDKSIDVNKFADINNSIDVNKSVDVNKKIDVDKSISVDNDININRSIDVDKKSIYATEKTSLKKPCEIQNTSIYESAAFGLPVKEVDPFISSKHLPESSIIVIESDPTIKEFHDDSPGVSNENTDHQISQTKVNIEEEKPLEELSDNHEPIQSKDDNISCEKYAVTEDHKELNKKISLSNDNDINMKSKLVKTSSLFQKKEIAESLSDDSKPLKAHRLSSKLTSLFSADVSSESKNNFDIVNKKERATKLQSRSTDNLAQCSPTSMKHFSPSVTTSNSSLLSPTVSTSPWAAKKKTDFSETKTLSPSVGEVLRSRSFKSAQEIEKKPPVITRSIVTQKIPGGIAAKMANKFTSNDGSSENLAKSPIKTPIKSHSLVHTFDKNENDAIKSKTESNVHEQNNISDSSDLLSSQPIEYSEKEVMKLNIEEVGLVDNKILIDNTNKKINSTIIKTDTPKIQSPAASSPVDEKITNKFELKKVDLFKPPSRSSSPLPKVVSPIQNRATSFQVKKSLENQVTTGLDHDHPNLKGAEDGGTSPTRVNLGKKLVIGTMVSANEKSNTENTIKMKMGSSGCVEMNLGLTNSHKINDNNGDDGNTSEEGEIKDGKSFTRTMLKDTKEKSKSLTRRRGGPSDGSPQAQRKNYRRLYVSKTRTSRVLDPTNCVNNDAAKVMQRVDNDVLKIEFQLKSTDLKLLP